MVIIPNTFLGSLSIENNNNNNSNNKATALPAEEYLIIIIILSSARLLLVMNKSPGYTINNIVVPLLNRIAREPRSSSAGFLTGQMTFGCWCCKSICIYAAAWPFGARAQQIHARFLSRAIVARRRVSPPPKCRGIPRNPPRPPGISGRPWVLRGTKTNEVAKTLPGRRWLVVTRCYLLSAVVCNTFRNRTITIWHPSRAQCYRIFRNVSNATAHVLWHMLRMYQSNMVLCGLVGSHASIREDFSADMVFAYHRVRLYI